MEVSSDTSPSHRGIPGALDLQPPSLDAQHLMAFETVACLLSAFIRDGSDLAVQSEAFRKA